MYNKASYNSKVFKVFILCLQTYKCLGCLTNLRCLRLECGSSHDGLARALKGMHR